MRQGFAAFGLLLAVTLDASGARADDKCSCRALGRSFELGSTICLPTPKGARLATCGMVLNNTAWEFSDTPCVSSRNSPAKAGLSG